MAKDRGKLEFLGIVDSKEYYLDTRSRIEDDLGNEIPNVDYKQVVWRVPDIREAVVAEPGFLILSADYSQIEVKLMAHLSRDPVLIAAINSGKDIHSFNATEVFGAIKHFDYDTMAAAKKDKSHPRHTELVKLRNDIKVVTFGVPYGAGANKVALMTGMDKEAAQEFIDAFFAKFSVLGQWLKQSGDFAVKFGYSLSPRGRRRFYDLPSPTASEKDKSRIISQVRRYAGNHPIQAGNVDMLKPAMYQTYNDLRVHDYTSRGARILFCVHDELVTTAPEDLALRRNESGKIITLEELEVAKKAKQITIPGPIEAIMMKRMTESYDYIIPDILNKIDVAIGPIWEKA
jgi:DNA polymerase I-like protein with 3'-5' exonuclease and polymerase domains